VYYSVGTEAFRKFGCNHEASPENIKRVFLSAPCLPIRLEIKSFAPLNASACAAALQQNQNAICEYSSTPFVTVNPFDSSELSSKARVTLSDANRSMLVAYEDSVDNDYNDFVFSIRSTVGFCRLF
jgi:hypothetical protein